MPANATSGEISVSPEQRPPQHIGHTEWHAGYTQRAHLGEGNDLALDGRKIQVKDNPNGFYLGPTIFDKVKPNTTLVKEEIFGPVLPIISFSTPADALDVIRKNPNPLAFYVFTSDRKKEKMWVESVSFGGGCVNNTSWHLTNHHLPFGGIGNSGFGSNHGKSSFETFSHKKSVMKTPTWFDPDVKYPPFKGRLKLFKWIIR